VKVWLKSPIELNRFMKFPLYRISSCGCRDFSRGSVSASKVLMVEYSNPKSGPTYRATEEVVPFDAAFLAHSTFGDDALKAEILSLYKKQLIQARDQIATAVTATDWRFVMHTLRGVSASVGALQFAFLADEWERIVFPSEGQRVNILNDFDLAKRAFLVAAQIE
jgi:hypothetical protein